MRALVIAVGAAVLVLFGVGVPAAGALVLDPPPVRLGPVTVDPHVKVDPKTGIDVGGTTQLPGNSDPAVSVHVGSDGAQVSAPAGIGVTLTPNGAHVSAPGGVAVTLGTPPPATAPDQSGGASDAQPGQPTATPNAPAAPNATSGIASLTSPVDTATSHATSATRTAPAGANHSRVVRAADATSPSHAAVNGSIVEPHPSDWSKLQTAAQRIVPFLALLALAALFRVIVSAWARDVRRRRALSAS